MWPRIIKADQQIKDNVSWKYINDITESIKCMKIVKQEIQCRDQLSYNVKIV